MIQFEVLGTPAPKGSSRAILIAGRAVNVPGGSNVGRNKLRSWAREVGDAARAACGALRWPVYRAEPVAVSIHFHLARPLGHFGKRGLRPGAPAFPITKPDVDKLVRGTLDALTGILFDDDSRVVALEVRKFYAEPGKEGALIGITLMSLPRIAQELLEAERAAR